MSIQNDFLPFAAGGSANVEAQTTWAADTVVTNGFASGIANSAQVNKALRQSSIIASMVAQFIVDHSGQPALDNGTTATLEANLLAAITAVISAFAANALGSGGTIYAPQFEALTTTGLDAGGGALRLIYGNYGAIFRNDGTTLYILLTNSSNQAGVCNSLRPIEVNLASGAVTLDGTGAGVTFGGSVAAASANISGAIAAATLNITGSATLANAALSGTPTAPTQAAGDNTTKLATTAFVKEQNYLAAITGAQVLAALGYTPVQQGGGAGQAGNKIYLGWDVTRMRVQVDSTDVGELAFEADLAAYAPLSSFGTSQAATGYQKLPGGLILQWGLTVVSSATVASFPIAFPSACLQMTGVDAGNVSSGTTNANSISVQPVNAAQFRAWGKNTAGSFVSTNMSWFAIGY